MTNGTGSDVMLSLCLAGLALHSARVTMLRHEASRLTIAPSLTEMLKALYRHLDVQEVERVVEASSYLCLNLIFQWDTLAFINEAVETELARVV